ncbi:hypothetical protein PsorP6_012050 [Peronosclerospora sorghi]|uniref:Uncharacterized protein n=1 Tax=Peronosclerospora sorghi TaxID=230839 RepID=A0ACC0WJ79_9STRA|nr:hypothetical protein PsorP6_012050 [Peronosclerospora sorghi]
MAKKEVESGDESEGGVSSISGSSSSRSGSESGSGSDSGSSSGSESGSRSGSGSGSGSGSDSASGSGSGSESGSGSGSGSDASRSLSESSGPRKKLKKRRAPAPKKPKVPAKTKSRNNSASKKTVKELVKAEADAEADDEGDSGVKRRRGKLRIQDEDEEEDEEDDIDVAGLTEVEKEKRLLEKYEAKEQRNKERELKKRLAASQGKAEDGFSEEELPSMRRGGRNKESDRRKEALHNLKANKSSDKSRSILSNRFGEDESSEEEGGSSRGRDLAEKRRRRQELQRGGSGRRRSHADDDDDYSEEATDDRKSKKSKTADLTVAKVGDEDEAAVAIRPEENVPVNWNQANHYLLKRRVFFEKNFFEPFFPQLVRGVYVRVPIEVVDGEMVYRFCEVVNVCKLSRSYNFCGESTNTGIICAFGKSKREWKLNGISGHSLREREFLLWRAAVNKDRIHFPTHGEAKRLYSKKQKMITQHNYTEAQVDEMVRRKQAVGLSSVSLGVQRVRLERDLRAAQDMKNFEKALVLEERLQRLLAKNEERKNHNSDDVLRINEINRRNREANMQQDLHAQELNNAMNQKMTSAERLQFVRANQMTMYMSRDKLEKNLADGKLIKLKDGRVMTSNKLHVVEALPDDLLDKVKGVSERKQTGDNMEIDIDRLLAKQQERKQKDAERLAATRKEREGQVEFVGVAPTNVQEMVNATIRIKDDDGSWMTLRSAAEIMKEKQSKSVVSDKVKASRKGITVKEYFDRVKKRRVAQ